MSQWTVISAPWDVADAMRGCPGWLSFRSQCHEGVHPNTPVSEATFNFHRDDEAPTLHFLSIDRFRRSRRGETAHSEHRSLSLCTSRAMFVRYFT